MKSQINVLIISKQYPPSSGGGGAHSYYLANALSKIKNVNVYMITSYVEERPIKEKILNKNLTVFRINFYDQQSESFGSAIQNCLALINNNEIKPDIIHAQHIAGAYVGVHLSLVFNIPLIVTLHKTPIKWDKDIIRRSYTYCHLKFLTSLDQISIFIAGSKVFRKELIKLGVRNEKIRFIYHGVSIPTLKRLSFGNKKNDSVREQLNLEKDEILFICPSRLDKRKKIELFITAAGLLSNEMPEKKFRFLLTGTPLDDCEKKYLESLLLIAAEHNIKDNLIVKSFDFEEIPALFRLAYACVLPSSREGLGLVVLEALAVHTPVIVSQGTGVNEIIKRNGKQGLIFLEDDHDDLKRQMARLIVDNVLYKRLQNTGFKLIKDEFEANDMATKYIDVYREFF